MELTKLKAEEYPQLASVNDGYTPDPKISIAIVAREGKEIQGRVFIVCPAHIEGPWVTESKRGSLLGKCLMARAEAEAKKGGVTKLFAYGASEQLEDYLSRLGYERQPLSVWAKELV